MKFKSSVTAFSLFVKLPCQCLIVRKLLEREKLHELLPGKKLWTSIHSRIFLERGRIKFTFPASSKSIFVGFSDNSAPFLHSLILSKRI